MKHCDLTLKDIEAAHQAYEVREPRDLFYRAATELLDLSLRGATSLRVAEAIAVLLKSWNQAYYRYNRFDEQHFLEIESLWNRHRPAILSYRHRSIESFGSDDEAVVEVVFDEFERVLGPVGTAKCLHLLAPRFFPLWDNAIAKAYGLPLGRKGTNRCRYCEFMHRVKEQAEHLLELGYEGNPVKAIDEFNYVNYTRGLLRLASGSTASRT